MRVNPKENGCLIVGPPALVWWGDCRIREEGGRDERKEGGTRGLPWLLKAHLLVPAASTNSTNLSLFPRRFFLLKSRAHSSASGPPFRERTEGARAFFEKPDMQYSGQVSSTFLRKQSALTTTGNLKAFMEPWVEPNETSNLGQFNTGI